MTELDFDGYSLHDYLQRLRQEEVNSAVYNIVQGNLYDEIRHSPEYSNELASDLSVHLNNGEVEKAAELLEQAELEED